MSAAVEGTTHSGSTVDSPVHIRHGGASLPIDPCATTTLLDALRDAGVVEVKEACREGRCGACAVLLDGDLRLSCLVPAGRAAGAELTTAASDECAPARAALVHVGAIQCGYCIPGVVVAMTWARRQGRSFEEAFESVICRCGCHLGFREAATLMVAARPEG